MLEGENSKFPELKKYGRFLLENCLEDATAQNLSTSREVKLPLLSLFSHLNEEQLHQFNKGIIKEYFTHLASGNPLCKSRENIIKWREGTHPVIGKDSVQIADVNLLHHTRKKLLLDFIPCYTNDAGTVLAIAREIEILFAQLDQLAVQSYLDIRKEEEAIYTNELRESNKKLMEQVSIRKETEEKLAKTNAELEARVNERTRKLRNSEMQMRLITDSLPVLITYMDAEERYRFINKAYEDWFKLPRHSIYGKKLEDIIGADAYDKVKPTVKRVLSGETVYIETLLDYRSIGKKHVSVYYIPHIIQGKTEGYFALITDISEHKSAQERLLQTEGDLRKRNEELERINNDLDNFIYTASHDLKSPVVNLQGLTRIIRQKLSGELGPENMELLNMVDKSVNKLRNTISELTEIAKVQKDLEQDAEKVCFREIAEDVKEDINGMIAESGAIVSEEWLVPEIFYPRNNLRSILYNLLSNAVKYRSPDRQAKICISSFIEKGYIVLKVEDNGLGISLQQQPKLFSMFKRFHAHVEGTGIGLYIIKRIVENRGGQIKVESDPTSGSIFKVYLRKAGSE